MYNISLTCKTMDNMIMEYHIYELKTDFTKIFINNIKERIRSDTYVWNDGNKELIAKLIKYDVVDKDKTQRLFSLESLFLCKLNQEIILLLLKHNFVRRIELSNKLDLEELALENNYEGVKFMLENFEFTKEELSDVLSNDRIVFSNKRIVDLICSYRYPYMFPSCMRAYKRTEMCVKIIGAFGMLACGKGRFP